MGDWNVGLLARMQNISFQGFGDIPNVYIVD